MITIAVYGVTALLLVGILGVMIKYFQTQVHIRQQNTPINVTFAYKKNLQTVYTNLAKLSSCTTHQQISEVNFHINKALDYFEKNNLTVFERPPEKVRESINTYSKVVLEQIYKLEDFSDQDLGIDISPDEEVDALEEYQNETEEDRDARHARRQAYREELRRDAILSMLHDKKGLEDYLDAQTITKLKQLKTLRHQTGDKTTFM